MPPFFYIMPCVDGVPESVVSSCEILEDDNTLARDGVGAVKPYVWQEYAALG